MHGAKNANVETGQLHRARGRPFEMIEKVYMQAMQISGRCACKNRSDAELNHVEWFFLQGSLRVLLQFFSLLTVNAALTISGSFDQYLKLK
jgi:hypothetical protein